jgi:hypothetical protein
MLSRPQVCPVAKIAKVPLIIALTRRRACVASLPFRSEDYKYLLRKLFERLWSSRYREGASQVL